MTDVTEPVRRRGHALALPLAATAASVWAGQLRWADASSGRTGLWVTPTAIEASVVAPLQPALGLLGAALVIAFLTLPARALKVCALGAAIMAASAAGQIAALASPARRAALAAVAVAGGQVDVHWLPVSLGFAGASLMLAAAVTLFTTNASGVRLSAKYQRPAAGAGAASVASVTGDAAGDAAEGDASGALATPDVTAMWRAMDRGEDPTQRSG